MGATRCAAAAPAVRASGGRAAVLHSVHLSHATFYPRKIRTHLIK